MTDEYMKGIVNKDTIPTASDIQFQKTNPLARGDKNIKPLEVYAEHAEIKRQVYNEIKKLHETLDSKKIYALQGIINEFLNCLTPLKNLHDPGRLPIYKTVPRSTSYNKRDCVWATVSCLVQAYWRYELNSNISEILSLDKILVKEYLSDLKKINEHYPEMKITGAEDKGYWLEL